MVLSTTSGGGELIAPGHNQGANMRIKILRGTVVGGERVAAGAVVEASTRDAKYLLNRGKAEEAKAPAPKRAKAKAVARADASD